MIRLISLILLTIIQVSDQKSPPVKELVGLISIDSLKKHISYLGNDSLAGRGTGTIGGHLAAEYIAKHLKKYNILPLGDNQSYYQKIPMHGSQPLPLSQLRLYSTDNSHEQFRLGEHYLLYKTGAQTFVPNPTPLVFVGYGIIAPEFDYNDYQRVDVQSKIVVFLSGEPFSRDSAYFSGENPTIYSLPESKQRLAISRGAMGSILIPISSESNTKINWDKWKREFSFEDITLAYRVTGHLSVVLHPNIAFKLFEDALFSFNDVLAMNKNNAVQSFPLARCISFRGKFKERDFTDKNVVGLLEGRDPDLKDSYLLISSHYDHLGIGPPIKGDSIYNGVFDNAAGVSAQLELARIFAQLPKKPRRSIIFLFLTGEEKGLLGSTYYTDHPLVPLYRTIANINIDGLAMFDTFYDIIGIGIEFSTLEEYLQQTADYLDLKISPLPSPFGLNESFAHSDQISFANAGIPSMLISEGLNLQNYTYEEAFQKVINWQDDFYHTPFDDLNQTINYQAARQHTQVLLTTCFLIANSVNTPQWHGNVKYYNIRLQTIAERR